MVPTNDDGTTTVHPVQTSIKNCGASLPSQHSQGKLLAGASMLSHSYSGSCQQRGSTPVTPCTARSSRLQRLSGSRLRKQEST
jgi:hypothetical protein